MYNCSVQRLAANEEIKVPGRILAGLWLFFALVLGTIYQANLMGLLITPKLQFPWTTAEEFIAQSKYTLQVILGSDLDDQIKVTNLIQKTRNSKMCYA